MRSAMAVFLSMSMAVCAYAQRTVELGEIVVTPLHAGENAGNVPGAVTVITRGDIERSNAQTVIDVLKPVSGIVARDYFGNGTRSSIDIRGFGATAGQNTLVLIDGRRVNEIDLSGSALNQIPVESIERIEVIRGGSAALYGDAAVGGVVNIITKQPESALCLQTTAEGGSYSMRKNSVYVSGRDKKFGYALGMVSHETDGYRANGFYRAADYDTKFSYACSDALRVAYAGHYHEADFGLPGALRESQLVRYSRKESLFPNNTVGENDQYHSINATVSWAQQHSLACDYSFRRRVVDDYLVSSSAVTGKRIDTYSVLAKYMFDGIFLSKPMKFVAGLDIVRADLTVGQYAGWGIQLYDRIAKMRDTCIDKDSVAFYAQEDVSLTENIHMVAGYRHESGRFTFNSTSQPGPWAADTWWTSTPVDDKLAVGEDTFNCGINVRLGNTWRVYANTSRGFRYPATEEYYSLWANPPVNKNLLPQTSRNYDAGIEFDNSGFHAGMQAYCMNMKNELYYDPITFTNTNYLKTIHRGFDADVSLRVFSAWRIGMQYSLMDAYFREGVYAKNQLPFVPRHKASARIGCNFGAMAADAAVTFVGKQRCISDVGHDYSKMDEYLTCDFKVVYTWKERVKLFGAVMNVFNERYSEYGAISTVYSERGFYPSPERNFSAGVKVEF